jgi:hypothetical protein
MAIEFNCPHCVTPYKLKDELAGKKATCKNPGCRQVITIPALRATVPPTAKPALKLSPPKPEDIEAAALAALADAPKEEQPADTPIPVVCAFCEHTWIEPRDKAGKNVLCPNPECRQRNKVPVPKDDKPTNWRETPQGPSLAKQNFEKPADVMDAEAKVVSKAAWVEGGGADQDLEPIPLKRKLFFGTLVAVPAIALVYGVVWLIGNIGETKKDRFVKDALEQLGQGVGELSGGEGPLYWAMLHTAAGEYELTESKDRDQALKKALDFFTKARDDVRQSTQKDDPKKPSGTARYAAGSELALAQLLLGGTDDEVKEGVRYRWLPRTAGPRQRINEKMVDVHTELQRTLQVILPADYDQRMALARRLTRELVKKGQVELAADLPVMLFAGPEQAEAKAVIALEVFRADKSHPFPRQAADDLKAMLSKGVPEKTVFPSSAAVLWKAVGTEKVPNLGDGKLPAGAGAISLNTRTIAVGLALLEGRTDDAVEAARRPGLLHEQLKAAVQIAEWSPDPGSILDVAAAQVERATAGKKGVDAIPPASLLLRLAQLGGAAGKPEPAKALANMIADDGLKAWAKADALRLAATPGSPLDEAAFEAPDDAAKLKAGHAWGRYWVARHNTRVSGDSTKQKKVVEGWPKGTVQPLGLAGIALGLRDRER